jgi:nucleoside-diphosphate-sugar epimerase
MSKANQILITGANGYLGSRLVEELLNQTDAELVLALNAQHSQSLELKSAPLKEKWKNFESRLQFVATDLRSPSFDSLNPQSIKAIFHCAALTNFNVTEVDANAVNRDGAVQIFEWAKNCPNLEKLVYVSTLYVSGLRSGAIEESFCDSSAGFANHYERSKWEAEEYLRTQGQNLPWQIARVGTVLCDDESGQVTQHNAIHNTLKLFFYGLISTIPGRGEVPVYLVTGKETAEALFQVYAKGEAQKVIHIVHPAQKSLKLGETIDLAYESFREDPDFRRKRTLKPVFVDQDGFEKLVKGVQAFGGQILSQAVSSMAPFGRQLYIHKDIQAQSILQFVPNFHEVNAQALMRQSCLQLVQTRFGKVAR